MEKQFTLGMDVGGTKIDAALVDSEGNIVASHYRLINAAKDPEKTIAEIIDSANICQENVGQKASAIGIGIAGQIDKFNGIVRYSPNLPTWRDVSLRTELEHVLGIPAVINNDVRMITLGEWKHGAGKGVNDLVCMFVGTGIGGGIVSGGQLLEGCLNSAGELGHMTVVAGGRKCTCPNDGCLEAYAGGWAIAERAQDAVRANPPAGLTIINMAGDISKITAKTVTEAYKKGDPLAQRLVKDTSKYLAAGIVSIVNAFNPCLIILGGGVIQGNPDYVTLVKKRVFSQALQIPRENLRIILGELGNKAGIIGAAALARNLVH